MDNNTTFPVSLVIPCYNESDRIDLMFNGIDDFFLKWKDDVEVIIVNDGSHDNTAALITGHPVFKHYQLNISLVSQANTGKGGALKNGVLKATKPYILTLDADMATPPEALIAWKTLRADMPAAGTIYIGSREHKDSVISKKGNRKLVGNIFNALVRTLTPLKMHDTQCGFKLYPTAEAKHIFNTLFTNGWAHDVEILYKAKLDGMQIVEMPLEWHAVEGSKIKVLRDGIKMLMEVLDIVRRTRKTYVPVKPN